MRHKIGSPYRPLISAGVSEPVRDPAMFPGHAGRAGAEAPRRVRILGRHRGMEAAFRLDLADRQAIADLGIEVRLVPPLMGEELPWRSALARAASGHRVKIRVSSSSVVGKIIAIRVTFRRSLAVEYPINDASPLSSAFIGMRGCTTCRGIG